MWLIFVCVLWLLLSPAEPEPERLVLPIIDANSRCTILLRKPDAEESTIRMQVTESLTVLDVIASLECSHEVWTGIDIRLHRRSPRGTIMILCVDWAAITGGGSCATNFVVFPDDEFHIRLTAGAPSK